MPRVDFGNLYRFIASTGLVFMFAALLVPWFVSQNFGILLLTRDEIAALSPIARDQVTARQAQLGFFLEAYPWLSLALGAVGLAMLSWGVYMWRGRQQVVDDTENTALEVARQGLINASLEDRERAVGADADDALEDDDEETAPSSKQGQPSGVKPGEGAPSREFRRRAAINQIRAVEAEVFRVLKEFWGSRFEIFRNLRTAGGRQEGQVLDGVLAPRVPHLPTVFVEIKLIRSTDNLPRRMREVRTQMKEAMASGQKSAGSGLISLIVFVFDEVLSPRDSERLLHRLAERLLPDGDRIEWIALGESELYRMDQSLFEQVLKRQLSPSTRAALLL